MIKFETINGELYRMVDPEPLTPDADFPCVVRLIQDDSPMGLCNRWKYSEKQDFLKKDWTISSLENNLNKVKDIHYSQFEVIGYPVVEGSAEWAAYMAQQGNFVYHPVLGAEEYFWWNTEKNCISCKSCDLPADSFFTSFMLSGIQDSGWQIHEPEPEYKVGDWVEWCGDQYMVESAPPKSGDCYNIRSPYDELGCSVYPENITRKLSPSEVIVNIGCLSGTVKPRDKQSFHLTKSGYNTMIMYLEWLDAPTRSLVESLLKAQEEK